MSEKLITLSNIELVKLFGTNNHKLDKIRVLFPQIKIVSRGEKLKLLGSTDQIKYFEQKLTAFIKHINQYNSLTLSQIERLVEGDENEILKTKDDVILHGQNGKVIKARTANQRKMVAEIEKNDMLFAIGPAGTGKTYTAVAIAVKALKDKGIKRIILTRPAVEAGENLGFLPGDLKEKLDPYMQPLYDALSNMIPTDKLKSYIEKEVIQIAPLAFMRGRTLDNAFVILDEAQNTSHSQMKMFLTRMGTNAKFLITGDPGQIDLPKRTISGLKEALSILKNIPGIGMVFLDESDVIRHKIVKSVINAYEKK